MHFVTQFDEEPGRIAWKNIKYSSSYVDMDKDNRPIGVLCQWFKVNKNNKSLGQVLLTTHTYTEIAKYITHIPHPKLINIDAQRKPRRKFFISNDVLKKI